jgi:hypothetical protein
LDNVEYAKELVSKYKRSLDYLENVSDWTFDSYRETIRLSGIQMSESEMRRQWVLMDGTLYGTKELRRIQREVLQEGIRVFGEIAVELPRIRASESEPETQPTSNNSLKRKWWQFWK